MHQARTRVTLEERDVAGVGLDSANRCSSPSRCSTWPTMGQGILRRGACKRDVSPSEWLSIYKNFADRHSRVPALGNKVWIPCLRGWPLPSGVRLVVVDDDPRYVVLL